jgi:uncharacterized protein YoxC
MAEQKHQESVLDRFRGIAHGLSAESEKAAVREHELATGIHAKKTMLADLQAQIAGLSDQAQGLAAVVKQMEAEHDEVSAARKALGAQGTYAYSAIALVEKASLTETLTEGELDVRKTGEVAQP